MKDARLSSFVRRGGAWLSARRLCLLSCLPSVFGAMSDASSTAAWRKPRNLLPLPHLPDPGPVGHGLSRAVRRRVVRRQRWIDWANEGISVLNSLGHEGQEPPCAPPVASAAQAVCLAEVSSAYQAMPLELPDHSFGVEALRTLCAKSSCYAADRSDIESYAPSRVAWPPTDFKPVALRSLLGPADVKSLDSWESHLLRPRDEVLRDLADNPVKPYLDTELRSSPVALAGFVLELWSRGLVRFLPHAEARSRVGAFFIQKKNGQLRLILDTRLCNRWFTPPQLLDCQLPVLWDR